MSLIYLLNFLKIRLLKPETLLRILMILIGINSSASAQSLNEYCLSTVGQIEENTKTEVEDQTQQLPSFIDSVENLPELYKKPCTKFYRFFWGSCDRKTFFSYSPTLNRIFIQGYRQTDWGRDFAHLEISESETKSVPDTLIHSGFVEDVPALNGVLFQGRSKGEALFYDGDKVINLSNYFPQSKKGKQDLRWFYRETSQGRVFLAVDFVRTQGNPFIMELKPGLWFRFISVPKEFKNALIDLFTLQNDSRLWAVIGRSILIEAEDGLKNIIKVSDSEKISGPFNLQRLADGSVYFQVENTNTKSSKSYFLRQASAKANCEIKLDENNPVLLDPQLKN